MKTDLLLFLFALPFITSLFAFIIPLSNQNLKKMVFLLSLIPFAILIYGQGSWIGAKIEYVWFPAIPIEFYLRVDSLSLVFLYLTAIVIPISVLAVKSDLSHPNFFYGLVLLLQGFLISFFTARDLVVFTIFWEAMLIPLYFIISIWGGSHRESAAIKFLIYMIFGSALMVAAVLALYIGFATFNLDALVKVSDTTAYAGWIFAIFLFAFAVKTPLFPFHGWLPDAYYQAPVAGTILLSALLSKAGIYGILRIGVELFPQLIKEWSPLLLTLAIIGVFYGGLAAWVQKDFKRLIAYSSFAHVNFILVGLFVWSQTAHMGAILQAFNHGVTITALFLVADWLKDRIGSTSMTHASGLARFMPYLCWVTLFFVLANVALPGTNNFVGELLILFGLFGQYSWTAAFLTLTVILSAMYMLRWMQRVYFEAPNLFQKTWIDLTGKEFLVVLPLILIILWIGIYPAPFLELIHPTVEKLTPIAMEVMQ